MSISPTQVHDIPAYKRSQTEHSFSQAMCFPDMINGCLTDPDCPEIWLTIETHNQPIGFCYATPE